MLSEAARGRKGFFTLRTPLDQEKSPSHASMGVMTDERRTARKKRQLAARIGAYSLHASYESKALTTAAREQFLARFEREVDPDGRLPEAERRRRAEAARRAHMLRLSLKSVKARSLRKDT